MYLDYSVNDLPGWTESLDRESGGIRTPIEIGKRLEGWKSGNLEIWKSGEGRRPIALLEMRWVSSHWADLWRFANDDPIRVWCRQGGLPRDAL